MMRLSTIDLIKSAIRPMIDDLKNKIPTSMQNTMNKKCTNRLVNAGTMFVLLACMLSLPQQSGAQTRAIATTNATSSLSVPNEPSPTIVFDLPTINFISRNPAPMVAGQNATVTWSISNATTLSLVCTSALGGYQDTQIFTLPAQTSYTITAQASSIGKPSTCTWTAANDNGEKSFNEPTVNTVAAGLTPPALSLTSCTSTTPTTQPTAATMRCTVSNTGQTATTSIGYTSFSGMTVVGPNGACAAGGSCGTVTVTSPTTQGNYSGTLTAIPNAGSSATAPVNLVVNPPVAALSASIAPNPLNLTLASPGVASGTVTVSPTGGKAPYTYSWALTAGSKSTVNNNTVINPTISASLAANDNFAETWTVTVRDALAVTTTASVTVNFKVTAAATPLSASITPSPLNLTIASAGVASGTVTVSPVGGTGPYTYSWARTAGSKSTVNNNTVINPTISANLAANDNFAETWTVTVRDALAVTTTASVIVNCKVATVKVVTYIHTDGLGSPVARSNDSGVLIANSKTRYEAYGMTVAGTATPTIGFTGHVNDADTGLTYMQQRYYDPVAGRFLSEDPVTTDANTGSSFNRYVYANNNPYRYIDPDGRDARDDQIAKQLADSNNKCGSYCSGGVRSGGGTASENASNTGSTLARGSSSIVDLPQIPPSVVDFSAGAGDALLLGTGPYIRDLFDIGGVNRDSNAYSAGAVASLAFGGARLVYAAVVKTASVVAVSGVAASATRTALKNVFRGGAGKNWRPPDLSKYGSDAALRAAAGRTNVGVNAYGAGVTAAGAVGAGGNQE